MNDKNENELSILQAAYFQKLQLHISHLLDIAENLKIHWNLESLHLMDDIIERLQIPAQTYGYIEIEEKLKLIAEQIKVLLNSNETSPNSQLLSSLEKLNADNKKLQQNVNALPIQYEEHFNLSKVFFVLDKEPWYSADKQLITGIDYDVNYFTDIFLFIEAVETQSPAGLIINIDIMNPELESFVKSISTLQEAFQPIIFFISEHNDFITHLKAVRLNGKGFYLKPIDPNEIIETIERVVFLKNKKYRVLIVDDDIDTANYFADVLQRFWMETSVVTDPTLVEDELTAYSPDVVLLDLKMPTCSGPELATIIRQKPVFESIPIIFLSSEENKLEHLKAMQVGADDFVTKSTRIDYLVYTIRIRAVRYEKLRNFMVNDGLTNIPNHNRIVYILDSEVNRANRLRNTFSICMLDLDDFKMINDKYGHAKGDEVLRYLSNMFKKRIRSYDQVGRYGGEEFLVILPNTNVNTAKKIIDNIRVKFSSTTFQSGTEQFKISFSAGIATFPENRNSITLLQTADELLYRAKKAGKNKVFTASDL